MVRNYHASVNRTRRRIELSRQATLRAVSHLSNIHEEYAEDFKEFGESLQSIATILQSIHDAHDGLRAPFERL